MFDWQTFVAEQAATGAGGQPPTRPVTVPAALIGGAPPIALDQSELIDYREIAELASKLTKRKSEKHQQLGRAIAKALRGEAYCPANTGVRNATLFQIAGEIVEAYPYAAPDPIAELFRISLDRLREDSAAAGVPAANASPTVQEFASMLTRHQAPKQQKHATGAAIESAYQAALDLLPGATSEQANAFGVRAGVTTTTDGNPAVSGASEAGLDYRSIIIAVDESTYYLRHPQGRVYTFRCGSKESLRLHLQRQFMDRGGMGVTLTDDQGDMYPSDQILRAYGSPAKAMIYDYSATLTEFDQRSMILRSGFTMASMPDLTTIEPKLHPAVEAWLQQFSGGSEQTLTDLYDWIAATEQRHIRTNAAALVVVGPPSIGKSVFARALAHTWGQHEPSKFAYVLDRFNGALAQCPIWHADEQLPDDLSDSRFKEIVQEQQRHIELKGRERMTLVGCARIVITINDLVDLKIKGASGPDGVKACADRLAIFRAVRGGPTEAALDRVREAVADRADPVVAERLLIAQHLRWIQLNVPVRGQRFLGARPDRSDSQIPILQATADSYPLVFDAIADYLADPFAWERNYAASEQLVRPGFRFPIVAEAERLYVCVSELMTKLGVRENERWRIDKALRPFRRGDRFRLSFGAKEDRFRAYYVELDPELIEYVTECDAVPALLPGTRGRLKLAGLLREGGL